ncbi:alpha-mannosidase [Planotetraspora sp. GP83]|uniref:glycoside hydrolase family 38 N-terminal domain-containing protein n=1 Tax=Planotetraspora sp. GP83 TaxID=3156264 RepID=UPI003511C33E
MNPETGNPEADGDQPEIVVVPHTHWDREWYLPFQRFRMGLVGMLDKVLAAMDEDPLYRFTMDGQLAAVEDYLEIRPGRRADIARFAAEGRFAIGPWLILADEFLCSGETLIRNLEYGMRGAAELGGAMPVGYLPDQSATAPRCRRSSPSPGSATPACGAASPRTSTATPSLSTLWPADRTASARLLDLAWRRVIACSGHDSITGCGADETAQQVAARIAEAEQIGQAVTGLVGASLAASVSKDSVVVVNPSPFERSGLVLADLPEHRARLVTASGHAVPVQRLEHAPTLLDETVMDDLPQLLGRVHERELFGHEIVSWAAGDGVFTITVSRHASGAYDYDDLRQAILLAGPGPWRVRTLAEPVVTVAAHVTVPPLGRAVLTARPFDGSAPAPALPPGALYGYRQAPEGTLDNGLLRVRVAADGTLSIRGRDGTEVHGIGRIAHGGDIGDTYNYAPPPEDVILDSPSDVRVEEICSGPLVSVLEVTRTYDWPDQAGLEPDAPGATVNTVVTTRVELRAGEPYTRLELTMDVRCRDHRIRWHAPLPSQAAESFAEGRLAVVRRGLTAEGGCGEKPIPTFPAESFVAAGGLAVLLDHVTEYELVRHATPLAGELALTLVRSVGHLSKNRNPYRDEPAGPQLATPAAQCQGPLSTRFAVLPYSGSWHEAGLPRLAEEYRHELPAFPGTGSPAAAATAREPMAPVISGDGVMMAALRERDGWLEIRLVAEHPVATEAVLHGGFTAARLTDALGSPAAPLEVSSGAVRLPLRPFEIATVQLSWV